MTDADHGYPYSQDVITRLHGMAEVYRHFSQGKEVRTADLLDEAAGCISALMENMSAPSRGPYLMPLAVRLASERVRADAANTMRHDTTSDLSARLMCRVGVQDLGLVMAWVDQFAALALLPGGVVPDREAIAAIVRHAMQEFASSEVQQSPFGERVDALKNGGDIAADAIITMLSGPAVPDGWSDLEMAEAFYRAMYEDQGGKWYAVDPSAHPFWIKASQKFVRAMLSASPKEVSPTQKDPHHGR